MVLILAIALPGATPDAYLIIIVGTGLVFGMLAMSLDLLWGYSGILNLAPALSFGIGAYSWGIVGGQMEGAFGTLVAIAIAVLIGAAVAAGLAYVSFRAGANGIYFALMTLAAALVFQQVAQVATDLTGGSNGLVVFTWPTFGLPGVAEFAFDTPVLLYYLILATVVVTFCGAAALVGSRFGTVLKAIRESDQRTGDARLLDLAAPRLDICLRGRARRLCRRPVRADDRHR
ncbi:MAG: branched-chain amino acid ABC transporter permease [Microcella pacifica]